MTKIDNRLPRVCNISKKEVIEQGGKSTKRITYSHSIIIVGNLLVDEFSKVLTNDGTFGLLFDQPKENQMLFNSTEEAELYIKHNLSTYGKLVVY